jgi:hypothetical protein
MLFECAPIATREVAESALENAHWQAAAAAHMLRLVDLNLPPQASHAEA